MDLNWADGRPPKRRDRDWISGLLLIAAIVTLCALILATHGCAAVSADYAQADRMTYDVLAPLARERWIPSDSLLTASERDGLYLLLQSWDFRIRAAEDSTDAE
jgi:hypothetical protein